MSDEEMDFGGDGFGDDGDDAAFGDGGFGDDGDDAAFGDGGFGDEEDLAGFDMNDTSDYNFNYGSGSEPDNDLEVQISNCYHTSKGKLKLLFVFEILLKVNLCEIFQS